MLQLVGNHGMNDSGSTVPWDEQQINIGSRYA